MKSREWVERAKCYRNPNPDQWWTENLPKPTSALHWLKAEGLCKGCPVFSDCAEEGVRYQESGVVRAGIPLLASAEQNTKQDRYEMLERIATGQPSRDEKDPIDTSQLPGRNDPIPFKYQGHDFVSHAGASQILSISPRQIDWLRQHNRLGVSEIKIRRKKNHKGNPDNIYFPVHELVRLAEKREQEREANELAGKSETYRNRFGRFEKSLAGGDGLGTTEPGQAG